MRPIDPQAQTQLPAEQGQLLGLWPRMRPGHAIKRRLRGKGNTEMARNMPQTGNPRIRIQRRICCIILWQRFGHIHSASKRAAGAPESAPAVRRSKRLSAAQIIVIAGYKESIPARRAIVGHLGDRRIARPFAQPLARDFPALAVHREQLAVK